MQPPRTRELLPPEPLIVREFQASLECLAARLENRPERFPQVLLDSDGDTGIVRTREVIPTPDAYRLLCTQDRFSVVYFAGVRKRSLTEEQIQMLWRLDQQLVDMFGKSGVLWYKSMMIIQGSDWLNFAIFKDRQVQDEWRHRNETHRTAADFAMSYYRRGGIKKDTGLISGRLTGAFRLTFDGRDRRYSSARGSAGTAE